MALRKKKYLASGPVLDSVLTEAKNDSRDL